MRDRQLASTDLVIDGGVARVSASGEFDVSTAQILADSLDEACTRGLSVQLDMSGVTFMTASTLDVLVNAHLSLAEKGRNLHIFRSADVVKRVLSLTDMGWLEGPSQPSLQSG